MKTATVTKKWAAAHGKWVHFQHRSTMKRLVRPKAALPPAFPVTPIPVDCTGNGAASWPMDDNDKLGICGPAMCDHTNGIRTFGQGKAGFIEVHADLTKLDAQYEQVSGGDNGTDETMLVGPGGIWMTGIAGDSTAVVVDHLDIDITDIPLRNYCVDQFYVVNMAWSVPDDFLQRFTDGSVWDSAGTPDPNNGHYTAMTDVDPSNRIRCVTWGASCWMGEAFVASVQPEVFVTFSALQFRKSDGYDSKGRHVGDVAADWVAIGGNASIVQAVVAQFPPKAKPPAPPAPVLTSSPTPAQIEQAVAASLTSAGSILTTQQAIDAANAGIQRLFGAP